MSKENIMVIILSIFSLSIHAQHNMGLFEGNWKGEGQLFGKDANFKMNWSKTLDGKFIKLTFHNEFTDDKGVLRTMDAMSMYSFSEDSLAGYWFDTRGKILPLKGLFSDSLLTIYWGDSNTENGMTHYKMTSLNTIEVIDYFERNKEYIQFGSAIYLKL